MRNTGTHDTIEASDSFTRIVKRNVVLTESLYPASNYAVAKITRIDGTTEEVGLASKFNSRTSAGAVYWFGQIAGTPGSIIPQYIALSGTSLTISLADTTLSGEISTNGLGRKIGTIGNYTAPTAISGAGQSFSYTITASWTATATQTVNSGAIFTAASAGIMALEANFASSISLNNGDSITVTWSISS